VAATKNKRHSGSFKPGNSGRPKGAKNKLTTTVKETVLSVFLDLQENRRHNLTSFAKKYPRDFYNIAARLIPTEIAGSLGKIQLTIVRRTNTGTGSTSSGTTTGSEGSEAV
jgi:hypothetical protein